MKKFCVEREIIDHKNYYGGVKTKKTYVESEDEAAAKNQFLTDLINETLDKDKSIYFKKIDERLHSIIFGEDNSKLVEGSEYGIYECNEKNLF